MQHTDRQTDRKRHTDAIRRRAEDACVGNIEIAQATGLSRSAVSRTMRGINQKPATIRRIRDFLAQMDTDPAPDLRTPEPPALATREGTQ